MDNEKFKCASVSNNPYTLLIAGADTRVKRSLPKLLLKCSTRQLHNELLTSSDDEGSLGGRHAETNDVIISETMLRSIAPPNEKFKCASASNNPYNLLIAGADTKVKRRMPKLLLECSMQQLHNELIASPDDGGLVGARHAIANDVIISDTMLRSLAPP